MKKLYVFLLFILPLALLPAGVSADKAKPAPKKAKAANKNQAVPQGLMTDEEFESQLKYQHGTISLGNGIATRLVGKRFVVDLLRQGHGLTIGRNHAGRCVVVRGASVR